MHKCGATILIIEATLVSIPSALSYRRKRDLIKRGPNCMYEEVLLRVQRQKRSKVSHLLSPPYLPHHSLTPPLSLKALLDC